MTDILFTPIRLSELETLVQNSVCKALTQFKTAGEPQPETTRWFDLNELCSYLPDKPAKPTVYGQVRDGLIPCHKGAKKSRFLKSEIDQWLKSGKQKTVSKLASEADQYLKTARRKALQEHTLTPSNSLHKRQSNDSQNISQLQTIFQYLSGVSATASMVSDATGVPQKNLCRYKRNLEKAGRLWEVEKKPCKKTGFKAWYLSTNPANAPKNSATQLTLF